MRWCAYPCTFEYIQGYAKLHLVYIWIYIQEYAKLHIPTCSQNTHGHSHIIYVCTIYIMCTFMDMRLCVFVCSLKRTLFYLYFLFTYTSFIFHTETHIVIHVCTFMDVRTCVFACAYPCTFEYIQGYAKLHIVYIWIYIQHAYSHVHANARWFTYTLLLFTYTFSFSHWNTFRYTHTCYTDVEIER